MRMHPPSHRASGPATRTTSTDRLFPPARRMYGLPSIAPSPTANCSSSPEPSPPSAPSASTARSRAPSACGSPAILSWFAPSTPRRPLPSSPSSSWASRSDASSRALRRNGSPARTRFASARGSSRAGLSASWCSMAPSRQASPFSSWVSAAPPSTPASSPSHPSDLASRRPRGWSACKWHAHMRGRCSSHPIFGIAAGAGGAALIPIMIAVLLVTNTALAELAIRRTKTAMGSATR